MQAVQTPKAFISSNICIWLMCLLSLIEMLCFTYLQEFPELGVLTAVTYFISGLGICLLAMRYAVRGQQPEQQTVRPLNGIHQWMKVIIAIAFLIFICILLFQFGNKIFPAFPVD